MRQRFKFWMRTDLETESHIIRVLDNAKSRRKFTATIRDGVRLVHDLQNGRVDVLLELFPWVMTLVEQKTAPTPENLRLRPTPEPVVEIKKAKSGAAGRNFMKSLGI